jgi:hypothetical protein
MSSARSAVPLQHLAALLVDCDSDFASVEQHLDPALRGRSVGVFERINRELDQNNFDIKLVGSRNHANAIDGLSCARRNPSQSIFTHLAKHMNQPNPVCKLMMAASLIIATTAHAAGSGVTNPARPDGKTHQFSFGGVDGGTFLLDGKPLQIRSGEMHPQRIPREYWSQRVRMAKAMGLNTIAFYVMWNDLEQPDGSFDFSTGNRDIAGFLRTCREEGMWVLFRPGPYICGEWDFGGIPATLLKHPDLKIRTLHDKRFMAAQTRYLEAVAKVAKPFLASNGGPILMTQLENEYGSYQRKERDYMLWLKDFWTKAGFGPFYTSDGAGEHYLRDVVLPGVAVGLDPGENDAHWAVANKMNPGVPVFSSETYPGWLRHWGEGNWSPTNKKDTVDWYMKNGKSFNIFVLHGGTNFAFTAGANSGGKGAYEPDLTSYDYGAPIDEQGRATPEYGELRAVIASHLADQGNIPEPPVAPPSMAIADFMPERLAGLWDLLPPVKSIRRDAMWFETWGQNQGMAVYRCKVPAGPATKFTFEHLNDYGQIYLDGKRLATIDRRMGSPKSIDLPARDKPAFLEVLVEGMGHINFSIAMESDRKGLFGMMKLGDAELKNWHVSPLPLQAEAVTRASKLTTPSARSGSQFRGRFTLAEKPADTFFDMSKYEKGMVWVNGRYWSAGPQLRLYCPASWLKQGENILDIVELELTEPRPVRGCVERNHDMKNAATRNANNEW